MTTKYSVLGLSFALLTLAACSQDAPPAAESEPPSAESAMVEGEESALVEFLFVQHTESVTLEDGVLTLNGVSDKVLYFSDRPDRIVGRESLATFVDQWGAGEESFASVPPNAVITVFEAGQSLDAALILKDPVLVSADTMTYNVEILDGPQSGTGSDAAIFIDAFGVHAGKLGKPGKPGDPGGLREPGKPGRPGDPGKPGDPGGIRDADKDDDKPGVLNRIGRSGKRAFDNVQEGTKNALDRVF